MITQDEFMKKIQDYQNLDYEEVYVDERYKYTPYMMIEERVDEFLELVKELPKEDATKVLVQFIKTAENNIQSRFLITCDFREYAAIASAKSAEDAYSTFSKLLDVNFSEYVTTSPEKIEAAIKRILATIAQFMITPRTIVVYKRKDASEYSEATLTVSPSEIIDFNPLELSDKKDWKDIFDKYKSDANLPTTEAFNDYMEKHRLVKEYIKREPKSKSMYNRKGYEKTYNYIREVKQTRKLGLLFLGAIILVVLYFLLF